MLFKEQNINIISIAQIFYAVGGKTGEYIRYNTPLNSNELIYRLDGENYTYFNGQKFHICGGTAYFLPRGRHSQYDVDIVEHGDSIDIWFECDRLISEQAIACDMSSNRRVGELFIKLERLWRSKQDGYYYKCMSELYCLMRELSRPERDLESSKLGAIDGAVRYIDENFTSREFSYGKLPEISGLSYSYFKKLFITRFGVTPREYVIGKRIDYARDLLSTGLMSISAVAELAGFENVYYFSTVFKKRVGTPPGQFMNLTGKRET